MEHRAGEGKKEEKKEKRKKRKENGLGVWAVNANWGMAQVQNWASKNLDITTPKLLPSSFHYRNERGKQKERVVKPLTSFSNYKTFGAD